MHLLCLLQLPPKKCIDKTIIIQSAKIKVIKPSRKQQKKLTVALKSMLTKTRGDLAKSPVLT